MKYWAGLWALGGAWLVFACGSARHAGPEPSAAAGGSAGAVVGGSAGGNPTGGTGSAAAIALQDLCSIFTHDLCTYLMQCGGARYRDAAHCERELTCFGLPNLTAAAASGAIDYDPSKVGACHERFAQSPCTFGVFPLSPDIYDVLQYCPGTITPKLKAGASCSANGQCSPGLYCYEGVSGTCPGTCRAFLLQGEDCSDFQRCGDGLRCASSARCEPVAAAGSSCTDGCNNSVTCPEDQVCPTNLWCDRALDQCATGRLEGEPCGSIGTSPTGSFAECAVHLWCDGLGSSEGTCRKPSAQGGPCGNTASACEKGLHCIGYVPFGDAAVHGTCQPRGPVGTGCGAARDCLDGLTCISAQCQLPVSADAMCLGDVDCQSGLVCLDNKCTVARYPGDRCDTGVCTYSRCVDGICDFHAKLGEACAASTDCATDRCVAGRCYDDSLCGAPL